MEMTFKDIKALIAESVQVGYMYAVKAYEPVADMIREKELKKWCALNGIDGKTVNRMIQKGIISKHRTGESKNSPVVFSKSEIKENILILSVSNINHF